MAATVISKKKKKKGDTSEAAEFLPALNTHKGLINSSLCNIIKSFKNIQPLKCE